MKSAPGKSGLIMDEPLLWEKGKKGRNGMSIPQSDVPVSPLDEALGGVGPDGQRSPHGRIFLQGFTIQLCRHDLNVIPVRQLVTGHAH